MLTSGGGASFAENGTGPVYTATATDADGNSITYSISGTDAGLFNITTGGVVTFKTPPNYEAPADAGADNLYDFSVSAFDGVATASGAVVVAVTNVSLGARAELIAWGFDQPVSLLYVGGTTNGLGRNTMYVTEKVGRVRGFDTQSGYVFPAKFTMASGQGSLLGIALYPKTDPYQGTVIYYLYLTNAGDTSIGSKNWSGGTPDIGPSTGGIMNVGRTNSDRGWIAMGPDNLLYFSIGDGGASGDPGGNAQNTNSFLGKVLRIKPSFSIFPGNHYTIPPTNPFAVSGGAPEVWLYGLRNSSSASFDGDNLIIADAGQDGWEEINLIRPTDGGANLGWNRYEGSHPFPPGSGATSTTGLTMPVIEYPHGAGALEGGSVVGGYVYRGKITALQNQYIFGDSETGRIWSIPVSMLTPGTTLSNTAFTDRTAQFAPATGAIDEISSFGVDSDGNFYIVDFADGEVYVLRETE